ncbi:MAG: methionyl-tRNA formyltransferase [Omnitrophica WOR_2 bacterium GWF2_38_59]|nr:MAG: methionyl-tRNA formyltransferase [Omnitrophica WOR_2 bacterium GWF2_38_59]OGX53348.1 MAG: methionyl-tRNA formyltransferase [Omnitrophica WOR_2 bacterium RIFOXYA12_FULL_38_10]
MNIMFFGSDDFALAHLETLLSSHHNVVGCVTQPDRPKNRGMKVVVSPIKECALKNNIEVFQPDDLSDNDFVSALKKINAEIFVVIAYGKFLPDQLIGMPAYGAINVHGSLLPKYRGAAPINWAIINGDTETGVTIIRINAKMDAGDILSSEKVQILKDDTSISLREKMKECGKRLLLDTISGIKKGSLKVKAQDPKKASFASKLSKETGKIDWNKSAKEINDLIRGLQPWPGAYTFLNGKTLKILSAQIVKACAKPGQVVGISSEGILVAAKEGALLLKEVHLQDAKAMDIASFLRGHSIEIGFTFE